MSAFLVKHCTSVDRTYLQFCIAADTDCRKFVRELLFSSALQLFIEAIPPNLHFHGFRQVIETSMRQENVRSDSLEDTRQLEIMSLVTLTCDSEECASIECNSDPPSTLWMSPLHKI